MSDDVTKLLEQVDRDETGALDRLFDVVYDDLRVHASRQLRLLLSGGTLHTTAVVNEASLRLLGRTDAGWQGRRHFYFAASRAMHDVIVEHLRAKATLKRGGDRDRVPMDGVGAEAPASADHILGVSESLSALRDHDAPCADIVLFRFFGGLTYDQIADITESSASGVRRSWAYAQAWLQRHLEGVGS